MKDANPASGSRHPPQERSAHLPQAHLLLEEVGELLLPLGAVVLVLSALAFVVPAGRRRSVRGRAAKRRVQRSRALLPLKAVALLPSLVEIRLEAEGPSGRGALRFGLGAERRRPLQLGSHHFGVAAEVARSSTVGGLVAEEPGDGGVATTTGRTEEKNHNKRREIQMKG